MVKAAAKINSSEISNGAILRLTVRMPKDTVPTNLVTVIGHAIMLDGTLMRKVSIHNVTAGVEFVSMGADNATRDLMQKKMDHNHGALRRKVEKQPKK
jgi:hypothetical protein